MAAIEAHMTLADSNSNGLLPQRSTSNVLTALLNNCTTPTTIVAIMGDNVLPKNK